MRKRSAGVRDWIGCAVGIAVLLCTGAVAGAADRTIFVNVNVLTMLSDSVLNDQSVVVEDGVIVRIAGADEVPIPEDARLVDGTDRYLLPGLAEMHAHVTGVGGFDRLATLFVANGVTTIRGMLGRADHLELRQSLEDGKLFGPRLVTSGPSLNGRSVSGAADAARQVQEQRAAGFDFIKIHPGLTAAEFDALASTAVTVGIPFAGHVPESSGVRAVLAAGMATIDHLDGYFAAMLPRNSVGDGGYGGFFGVMLADEVDPDEIAAIAAETAAAGTWNVPTEVLVEQFAGDLSAAELRARPEMRYVTKDTLNEWLAARERQYNERGYDAQIAKNAIELRRRLILALHEAGAGLLLGSDAPQVFNVPGFSAHRELEVLVAAGLTPYEALRTGTVAAAEFLGLRAGTVAAGNVADLILLDANPLIDIRNSRRIHGVMLRGEWYSRRDLDRRLERIAAH